MGLLADALDVVTALVQFQVLRVKRRLNLSLNACLLAAGGVGALIVSMAYLLWGVHVWSFQAAGPAASDFLTAAAAILATAALALSAVAILRSVEKA